MFYNDITFIIAKITVVAVIILLLPIIIFVVKKINEFTKSALMLNYLACVMFVVYLIYKLIYYDVLYLVDKKYNLIDETNVVIANFDNDKDRLSFHSANKKYFLTRNSDANRFIGHTCNIKYYKYSGYIIEIETVN